MPVDTVVDNCNAFLHSPHRPDCPFVSKEDMH